MPSACALSYGGIYKDKNNLLDDRSCSYSVQRFDAILLSLVIVNYNINLTTTNLCAIFSEKTFAGPA